MENCHETWTLVCDESLYRSGSLKTAAEMDHVQIIQEGVNLIQVAKKRHGQWALVNKVTNLWVP
jgi:hypothetical protein